MRLPGGTPNSISLHRVFACVCVYVFILYTYTCVPAIKFAYASAFAYTLYWGLRRKSKFVQTLATTTTTAATARYLCKAQLSAGAALIATGNLKMPKLFTTTYINCPMSDVNATLIYWI